MRADHRRPTQIKSIGINISPTFIGGASKRLANGKIAFQEGLHVIAYASEGIERTFRSVQKAGPRPSSTTPGAVGGSHRSSRRR